MQANRNQSEQGRLGEYIAVEWEGETCYPEDLFLTGYYYFNKEDEALVEDYIEERKLIVKADGDKDYIRIFLFVKRQVESSRFKIIDAVKISIREEDIVTIFHDIEMDYGLATYSNTVALPYSGSELYTRRWITIFPAELLDPTKTSLYPPDSLGYFNRKVLRCISGQAREKSPALKTILDIANTVIHNIEPSNLTAEPQEQTPGKAVSNTDKPGRGTLPLPPGLKVKNESRGGALDAYFIENVLSHVKHIRGTETTNSNIWEQPTKTKPHRNRDYPWTVFDWKGVRYRVWKKTDPKTLYAVKLEKQEQGSKNHIFDFKDGG